MALPQPRFVTREEIRRSLATNGHKISNASLQALVTKGLLPKHARIEGRGRGKGVQPLYPASAIDLARRILEMRERGLPDEEIREQLDARERELALHLIRKHLDFHRILSPEAHGAWLDWVNNMVDRIKDWSLTDEEKQQRVRHIAGIHVREFRLILDTIDSRLRDRTDHANGPMKAVLEELKLEIEAKIEEFPIHRSDLFLIASHSAN